MFSKFKRKKKVPLRNLYVEKGTCNFCVIVYNPAMGFSEMMKEDVKKYYYVGSFRTAEERAKLEESVREVSRWRNTPN